MKTQRRIIAAILSVMIILTALPLVTFAQALEYLDASVQKSAGADEKPYSKKIISEDPAKRSENEKHFQLDDGTYLAVKYPYPVHKQNDFSEWQDIDLSFSAEKNADADVYISETDALSAAIANGNVLHLTNSDDTQPVSLEIPGLNMTYVEEEEAEKDNAAVLDTEAIDYENIQVIEAAMKSPSLHFADDLQGIELIYEKTYSGIRQNIVITRALNTAGLSFALNTGDLTAILNENGSVEIKDGDKIQYSIPVPYMYDSKNQSFALMQYSLEKADDGYILLLTVDSEQSGEDISYPVTISTAVTVPFAETNRMAAVSSDTYTGETKTRMFFHTDALPALAEDDIMLSAQLHTYQYDNDASPLAAYSVTEGFDADSITWNSQPAYSSEKKACTFHGQDGIFAYAQWDITEEALHQYDGVPA